MSRKRTAPSLEAEDDRELSRSKRVRVSGRADDGDDTDSVDDNDDTRMHDSRSATNGARRSNVEEEEEEAEEEGDQDAFASDGDEVDELAEQSEDEAMREEMRTQSLDARDRPAEAGIIDEVDLKNFMCHRHLSMKLGRQLNFVIGHNGSGKSAILTGITIALGGKATSTSRGSSLKSFVREGADSAEVVLTMRNEGVEAFKPDLYGKKIIIERRILSQGGTSWKLKNDAGKVVSTKREEIDAYCDHTNIQVDNPMNVLSQDAARQFLSSSAAKDKYAFYLKGTQLTQLASEYDRITEGVDQMNTAIAKNEESLPDLQRAVREAIQRYKTLDKARGQKEELIKLQEKMVWSQVVAKEHEVKQQRAATDKAKEKLDLVKEDIEKQEAALEELDQEIQEVEDRAKSSREREAPLKEERARLAQQIRAQMERVRNFKDETAQLNEQFTQLEQDMKRLQKDIDAEAARLAPENRDKIQALRDEQEESVRELEDLKADEADLRRDHEALSKEIHPIRGQLEDMRRELSSVQRTIADKESQLQTMHSSRSEKLMVYGPSIMAVLKAIEGYNGWRNKPLGPLGRYVKLRDQKWSNVIESVLNNLLTAFVVTNFHDRRALQAILTQNKMNDISIIVSSDDDFDFSAGEPDPAILTVRRALEVTERAVLRVLVNTAKIEKAALVVERVQGDKLVRQNPRNVAFAFSADMFRISGGARGSSTQTLNQFRGAPRLATNIDDGIRRVKEELHRAEQQKMSLDRQIAEQRKLCNDKEKEKQDIKTKLPGMGRRIRVLEGRISQIDDELKEDAPANVAALHENLQEAGRDKERVYKEIEKVMAQGEEAEAGLKPLVEKSDKLKEQLQAFIDSRETFREKLEAKTPQRMQTYGFLQHRKDQLEGKQRDHEEQVFRLGQLEAELEDWTSQAEEYCPRVEASADPEEYNKKIQALEELAAKAKKRGIENIDDVLAEMKDKKKVLKEATNQIEDLRAVCKMFYNSMQRRQEGWLLFQKNIAIRARFLFTQHLEHRGYTGSISFDHQKHTLRLRVQTEDMTKNKRDKDPKSLSGGEKSFATICLLLALWEAIGCPIRCLDEFDVFMDAVNRKISMKMIAATAKKNPGTQFVLITPQNMANVSFGSEVRILRMGDPERGQGALQAGASG